jgi:hypothetical protein
MNLDPNLIEWVEKHFQMKKLLGDYPHWDDVASERTLGSSPHAFTN